MPRVLKPKVVSDVRPREASPYRSLPRAIHLGRQRIFRIPLTAFLRGVCVVFAMWFLIGGSVAAPTQLTLAANPTDDERKALEAQLHDLEGQIDQYESQIVSYQKQGSTLKNEIASLNSKVAKLNLQIQAINLTLRELDRKISDTQFQIGATEDRIRRSRQALAELLRDLYRNDRASLIEIFLKNPRLSDFFGGVNQLAALQANLRSTISEILVLHDTLSEQKEQFALARADTATLRDYQAAQKEETNKAKEEKNRLLTVTKGVESKYQELLKTTKTTAAQIRSRIFQLLGGGELTFEEALKYAKLASGATGVRSSLILAVLDRESALGRNVGRCSYRTAMSPKSQDVFLTIVRELNVNPDTMTVSCPNADGVYGGAMGPAQFIPSTWQLYRDAISRVTGRTPPSPWNNADAFVATALYLKDAMKGCDSIYDSQASRERCAAAKYYAGGRWRRYLWTYGEAVVKHARSFQEDIDTISG